MFISISYVCVFVQYHQMVIYTRNVSSYRQVLSMPVIIMYSICYKIKLASLKYGDNC